jgi:hypothetical protein
MHDSFVAERNVPREPLLAFSQGEQSQECSDVKDPSVVRDRRRCGRDRCGGAARHNTTRRQRLGRHALQRCVRPSEDEDRRQHSRFPDFRQRSGYVGWSSGAPRRWIAAGQRFLWDERQRFEWHERQRGFVQLDHSGGQSSELLRA